MKTDRLDRYSKAAGAAVAGVIITCSTVIIAAACIMGTVKAVQWLLGW